MKRLDSFLLFHTFKDEYTSMRLRLWANPQNRPQLFITMDRDRHPEDNRILIEDVLFVDRKMPQL